MALLKNAIKKAEKLAGISMTAVGNGRYSVIYKGYTVEFACNGRMADDADATCYYTKKIGAKDDLMTDYFAGTFHDNINQCFKFIDHMAKPN